MFLMSSRPLDKENYLLDPDDVGDEYLPLSLEMGTIYYYKMNGKGDDSSFLG